MGTMTDSLDKELNIYTKLSKKTEKHIKNILLTQIELFVLTIHYTNCTVISQKALQSC